jgi:glycosyltransferase involved in cell wall biosynthesis
MSRLTILLGTYKKPNLIGQTIRSILSQSFRDFELVIFDDNHSEDEVIIAKTLAVIESFNDKRIKYIKNKGNVGVPHVFRKWIQNANLEYFMIYCDGDILLPEALDKMINYLDNNPRSSMVHGLEIKEVVKKQEPVFNETTSIKSSIYLENHLLGRSKGWSQLTAMFRTELWKSWDVPVVHDHYWDFYFHCVYLLFSNEIGYLNEYITVRERTPIKYEDHVAKNYFSVKIERTYQAIKFIDYFEFYMISRGYKVNNYRLLISLQLLKRFSFLSNPQQIIFAVRMGVYNLIKSLLGFLLVFFSKIFGFVLRGMAVIHDKFKSKATLL